MMPWRIRFDDKMRLEGPYRYFHCLVCVLGAMGAGRIFFPEGTISFLLAYLLVFFMSLYGVVFGLVLLGVKKQRTKMPGS